LRQQFLPHPLRLPTLRCVQRVVVVELIAQQPLDEKGFGEDLGELRRVIP
jgi:hypothetical protein